jgi:hypothetical protein
MSADVVLVEDIKGTSRDILEANLSDGEPVFVFMEGVWGQSIAATDRRVMIIKTGLQAGGAGFGKKCKTLSHCRRHYRKPDRFLLRRPLGRKRSQLSGHAVSQIPGSHQPRQEATGRPPHQTG